MKKFFLFCWILLSAVPATAQPSAPSSQETVVEGTLTRVSALPTPENNPYPDCYYTAVIEAAHIISGKNIPKKTVLVLPGFFSRKYAPEASFKTGDKIRAVVVPFSLMPDKVRQTQQADEIEDVDLEFFYPTSIEKISELTAVSGSQQFLKTKTTASDHASSVNLDLSAKLSRQETIRRDLEKINDLLVKNGGDWDKWYETLKSFREEYARQQKAKAQKWIGNSYFSAGYVPENRVYSQDFIKSVVAFRNYLAQRNVDLILVRVPTKGEIVADLFAPLPAGQPTNPYLLRMYKELLEADVEIITDIIPKAKEARLSYPLMFWYQDFLEIHPAEGISWVVAEELAKRTSRYSKISSMTKKNLLLKQASQPTYDFKWPEGNKNFNSEYYVQFTTVNDEKGAPLSLKQNTNSPVVVLGSSYLAFPSLYKGGSIPHYFAFKAGIVPDILHRSGADRTIPRSIAREGDEFLNNRVVCLFPFTPDTAYVALSSPPLFDPDKSPKTVVASYTRTAMRDVIEIDSGGPPETISFTQDGVLQIKPMNKQRGAAGTIKIRVPERISSFRYFILEMTFDSKDQAYLVAKYGNQTDSVFRSDTQVQNDDAFTFLNKNDAFVEVNFAGSVDMKRPTRIEGIKFLGVTNPNFYENTVKSNGI